MDDKEGRQCIIVHVSDWKLDTLVHELAHELKGRAHIVQIDVDERPDYSARNGVSSIPCFIVLRDGKEVARQVGAIPKSEMRRMLGL